MQKKSLFIVSGVVLIGLMFGAYQYFQAFHIENVSAVTIGTPNPGHAWSSMECSSDTVCIDATNKRMGIGTNVPSKTLEVNGDIKVAGDVCTSAGVCLSALGVAVSGTALVNGVHSYKNCTDAGGTVVSSGQIGDQCRFNLSACPTGWTRFRLWSATAALSYSGPCYCGDRTTFDGTSVTSSYSAPAFSWQDGSPPAAAWGTVSACGGYTYGGTTCRSTVYAPLTQIGCY